MTNIKSTIPLLYSNIESLKQRLSHNFETEFGIISSLVKGLHTDEKIELNTYIREETISNIFAAFPVYQKDLIRILEELEHGLYRVEETLNNEKHEKIKALIAERELLDKELARYSKWDIEKAAESVAEEKFEEHFSEKGKEEAKNALVGAKPLDEDVESTVPEHLKSALVSKDPLTDDEIEKAHENRERIGGALLKKAVAVATEDVLGGGMSFNKELKEGIDDDEEISDEDLAKSKEHAAAILRHEPAAKPVDGGQSITIGDDFSGQTEEKENE